MHNLFTVHVMDTTLCHGNAYGITGPLWGESTDTDGFLSHRVSSTELLALCEGNPPVTGEFSSQRANNAQLYLCFTQATCDIGMALCEGNLPVYSHKGSVMYSFICALPRPNYLTLEWPLCEGNLPMTGILSSQRACNIIALSVLYGGPPV